ncbi:hypothetical protein EJB05_28157 [Eragrostis curvula]|uniref:Uncharacterized protein n=1 Tax=Eragrostis curvula TaxID=38414 RepID=A0A5J9UPJ7_9POAL|nr:hypothetical protein EJB05_28157 [Eragrostis curvula]
MEQHCRIPAFGEWNYGQYDYRVDAWTPLTPCFDAVAMRMTNALPASKPDETKPHIYIKKEKPAKSACN